jgi:hypothetical protein
MAIKYWDGGAGTGVISTAANWDGDALPANGDTIIFSDNSANITGDLTSKTDLNMVVGNQWTGNFGSSSTPLEMDLVSLEYSGTGSEAYIDLNTSTVTNVDVQDTGFGSAALVLGGTVTITKLRVTGGRGTIKSSGARTVTTVECFGAKQSTLDLTAAAVTGTTLKMDSGTVKISGNYTNIEVSGGSLYISGTPTGISTVDIYGGDVLWNVSGATAAITSRLSVYDGSFDATESTASVSTITGAEVYEDGLINEQNGIENITWSGGITTHGGRIIFDSGRVLTIT